MSTYDVLMVPGWKSSGPGHWQTLWQAENPDYQRVEQQNWERPIRTLWVEQLELQVQKATKPVVLVGHGLGCITIVHWARFSENRVLAALLVAPTDAERRRVPHELRNFAPVPRKSMPFPTVVAGSSNDPMCSKERTYEFARSWGSEHLDFGKVGHLNEDSGHGVWSEGAQVLQDLIRLGLLVRNSLNDHYEPMDACEPFPWG